MYHCNISCDECGDTCLWTCDSCGEEFDDDTESSPITSWDEPETYCADCIENWRI